MEYVRTPDDRFENLAGYSFEANYMTLPDTEGGSLRMHYLDEGPRDGEVLLCIHGQPVWSYLYRKMIPIFTAAGYRVIAPDLIGFGKSDKPTKGADYTYERHVGWVTGLVDHLDLANVTFVGQDWGGLIGLRVVAENPDRFARVCIANTGLPDGGGVPLEQAPAMRAYYDSIKPPTAEELPLHFVENTDGMGFLYWVKFAAESTDFNVGNLVRSSLTCEVSDEVIAGYNAPFPDEGYMAGARKFPSLVPIIPDDPAIPANKAAWEVFRAWKKPFLTAFSDMDPVTAGGFERFQTEVPGAQGQAHTTVTGGGHFLQEDQTEQFATVILQFMRDNPLT